MSRNDYNFVPFHKNLSIVSTEIIVFHSVLWVLSSRWGRVTHICVSDLPDIGSDNGLSPGRRQAIIWTTAGLLLIWTLGTNTVKSYAKSIHFHSRKCVWKSRLRNGVHLSQPQCVRVPVMPRPLTSRNHCVSLIKVITTKKRIYTECHLSRGQHTLEFGKSPITP